MITDSLNIIQITKNNVVDLVDWNLANNNIDRVYELIYSPNFLLKPEEQEEKEMEILKKLEEKKEFERLAQICLKFSHESPPFWEKWVKKFIEYNKLSLLIDYIPIETVPLSKSIYNSIFYYFIINDPEEFLNLVRLWKKFNVYDPSELIKLTEEFLQKFKSPYFLEAVSELYIQLNMYENAIITLLDNNNLKATKVNKI